MAQDYKYMYTEIILQFESVAITYKTIKLIWALIILIALFQHYVITI